MITEKIKNKGIALLRSGESIQDVSEVLEIPYMLVKEWAEKLDNNDLIRLEANTHAITKLANSEILNNSEQNKEFLRLKVEETALEIVDAAKANIHTADIVQSRSLQLLANTCTSLYKTILGENKVDESPIDNGMTMLEQIGID